MKYIWKELNRPDKTNIIKTAMLKYIIIRGNNKKVGLPEININIGKNKPNLRIDILEINKSKNELVGYEIKSCIQDFRADKKWEKYLSLINQLYFIFDKETFETHKEEILNKIENKAGIYIFTPNVEWISLKKGVKFTELEEKQEDFYRIILFNYLFRNAIKFIKC